LEAFASPIRYSVWLPSSSRSGVISHERAERVALQSRAMQSLELLEEGRLAVMRVTQKDFSDSRAGVARYGKSDQLAAADPHRRGVDPHRRAGRHRPGVG